MTEIPEHLLQRSRDRKRAMGIDVPGDAPAEAAAESASAPAVVGGASPATSGAPVPIPAAEPPAPTPPTSQWVAAAEGRSKVPYWVMPVLLFLPIWLIMYVGTLEEPTRSEGVLYEGGTVYATHCASCHGASGGGGVGPAFNNGAIIETFANFESHAAWVVHGTQGYADAGFTSYGDNGNELGGSGANMPAFGAELTVEELIYVTFYERIELGGFEDELPLAEALFDKLDHGELEVPEHFAEGPEGDFEAEIAEMFAKVKAELAGDEVAAG